MTTASWYIIITLSDRQPILEDGAVGKSEYSLEPKTVREELKLSQAGFADLLGVSTRAVQSWEQGWRTPSSVLQESILLALIAWRQGDRPILAGL